MLFYGLLALFGALASVSAAGYLLMLGRTAAARSLIVMVVLISVSFVLTAVFALTVPDGATELPPLPSAVGTMVTLLSLWGCAWLFAEWLSRRQAMPPIWTALLVSLGATILALPFATQPEYGRAILLAPTVPLAFGLALANGVSAVALARTVRAGLIALCVGSVALWLASPEVAARVTDGAFGALGPRWQGLTAHPNSLGYVAGAVLVSALWKPLRFRGEPLWLLAALIPFVGSQSKTVWGAVAVGLLLTVTWRASVLPPVQRSLAYLGSVVALCGLLVYTVGNVDLPTFDTTLTGRTALWKATLQEFQRNPVAGYGPGLWSVEYRAGTPFLWAGQAHNQLIQTLGASGLIGAAGLFVFTAALLVGTWRSARVTRGASLALTSYFLLRAVTESPLGLGWDGPVLILALVLLPLSIHSPARQTGKRSRPHSLPVRRSAAAPEPPSPPEYSPAPAVSRR